MRSRGGHGSKIVKNLERRWEKTGFLPSSFSYKDGGPSKTNPVVEWGEGLSTQMKESKSEADARSLLLTESQRALIPNKHQARKHCSLGTEFCVR